VVASAFSAFAYGEQGGAGASTSPPAEEKEEERGEREREGDDLSGEAKRRKTDDDGGRDAPPGALTSPPAAARKSGGMYDEDDSPVIVVAAAAKAGSGGGGGKGAAKKKGRAALLSDDDEEEEGVVDLTGGSDAKEEAAAAPAKSSLGSLPSCRREAEEEEVVRVPSDDDDDESKEVGAGKPEEEEKLDDDEEEEDEELNEEEEYPQQQPNDVVAQCERVAADLRRALGLAKGADRVNATGEDDDGDGENAAALGGGGGGKNAPPSSSSSLPTTTSTSGIMTAAEIAAAAGHADSGACLRLFQVVGVNFLLLLDSHRCRNSEGGSGGSGSGTGGDGGEKKSRAGGDEKPETAQNGGGGSGCIIADEMGLGKTAQCCTFIAVRKARLVAIAEAAEAEAEQTRAEARRENGNDDAAVFSSDDAAVFSSDDDEEQQNPSVARASAKAAEALEASLRPALVVVPSSLVDNWSRELAVFAPRLHVLRFHTSAERKRALREFGKGKRAIEALRGEGVDVVLTTYPLFESSGADAREARSWLKRVPLGVVALDEAHAIKAGAAVSARARRIGEIAGAAAMRVFLTGTPLQNKLGELKTLLAFLLPGFDWEQLADDEEDDEEDGEGNNSNKRSFEQAARLRKALAPFCLRRLKSEVAKQLPPKTREDIKLKLPDEQRRGYDSALRAFAAKINANGNSGNGRAENGVGNGDNNNGTNNNNANSGKDREEALRLLRSMPAKALASSFTHLRKLANQPLLVRGGHYFDDDKVEELARASAALGLFGDGAGMGTPPGLKPGSSKDGGALLARIREELLGYSDLDLHNLAVSGGQRTRHLRLPDDAPLRASAKSSMLAKLLPQLKAKGSRVLIFSQWLGCLDVLGMLLDHLGLTWSRLDGSTPVAERMALVDEFNGTGNKEGGGAAAEKEQKQKTSPSPSPSKEAASTSTPLPFAMLLSTKAGGQGLNLTGADTVVFHDIGFNPSVEKQGEDRAHRLGQTRPVKVYRLVSEGTVDEGIVELARRKAALGDAVMGEGGDGDGEEEAAGSGEKEGMAQLLMKALEQVQGSSGGA